MPGSKKNAGDPLAQFDFLLSVLKDQLEEAQRTAEQLKQHRDSASTLWDPKSDASTTLRGGVPQPEQGTKQTQIIGKKNIDEHIIRSDFSRVQEDPVDQSLEQKIFARLLQHKTEIQSFLSKEIAQLGAAKVVKKAQFRVSAESDEAIVKKAQLRVSAESDQSVVKKAQLRRSAESDQPVVKKAQFRLSAGSEEAQWSQLGSLAQVFGPVTRNSNFSQFHQEYSEDHALNQGGFKMKTFFVSFTTLFVIYAVIAILGFTVFDMYHEDEPWRYFAAEEVWDQKGVPKWSSSYTGILHNMPLPDFQKFNCVINWITLLYLGFGSEALVGIYLLSTLGHEVLEELWLIAQFCFPLLISMAFQFAGEHNPWSYLFFIVGMWKFCFPETLFYLTRAMAFEQGFLQFAADVCNGMGTMMHHGSSALLLCLIQADMLEMTQVAMSVIVPLILQHLIALLKYKSLVLYAILELALEIIWEREVFSVMQNTTGTPWFAWVGTQGLLFAHWLYWLAVPLQGVADMLKSKETREEEAETQHDEIAKFRSAMLATDSMKTIHERDSERKSREVVAQGTQRLT